MGRSVRDVIGCGETALAEPQFLVSHMLCPRRGNPTIPRPVDSRSLFVPNVQMSVVFEISRDFPFQVAHVACLPWLRR